MTSLVATLCRHYKSVSNSSSVPKSQLGWLKLKLTLIRFVLNLLHNKSTTIYKKSKKWSSGFNLPHLPPLPPPVTAKQRVIKIPGDQPEKGTDGSEEKDFEEVFEMRLVNDECKTL